MKERIILFFIMGMMGNPFVSGQGQKSPGDAGFLWKIEKDFRENYLLGAVHPAGQKGLFPLSSKIEAAFAQSTVLALEEAAMDFPKILKLYESSAARDKDKIDKLVFSFAQKSTYIGEDNLRNHVSADLYDDVVRITKKWNLNLRQLVNFKPWAVGISLFSQVTEAASPRRDQRLQDHFLAEAKGRKELVLWELNKSHLLNEFIPEFSSFVDFLENQNESILKYGLAFADRMEERDARLLRIWQEVDIKEMEALIEDETREFSFTSWMRQKTMARLSKSLVPKIVSLLETGKKCFIVMDADSLLGQDGLIAQLRRKGFRIQPYQR